MFINLQDSQYKSIVKYYILIILYLWLNENPSLLPTPILIHYHDAQNGIQSRLSTLSRKAVQDKESVQN